VAKPFAAADPSNTPWQSDLLVSYFKLGEVAPRAGKLEDARGWFDKALAVNKRLAAVDPSNVGRQLDLCTTLVMIVLVAEESTEATDGCASS
jgi:hypothetical protein